MSTILTVFGRVSRGHTREVEGRQIRRWFSVDSLKDILFGDILVPAIWHLRMTVSEISSNNFTYRYI